jgi:hypothetical protein
MIIGTNAYAPGLTVRWERGIWESVLVSRLGQHHSVCEATRSTSYNAKPLYVVFDRTGYPCTRKTFARRCDAKRAAEWLVGQWWREKCEREASARAQGPTAARTVTLPAAFFDATAAMLPNLGYAKLVQEAGR